MAITFNIATVLLAGVALILAILRIREQNRLKAATRNLILSYSEFGRVLDKVEEFTQVNDHDRSLPRVRSKLWYVPYVSIMRRSRTKQVRRYAELHKYHDVSRELNSRVAFISEQHALAEQYWGTLEDTDYDPSHAWNSGTAVR